MTERRKRFHAIIPLQSQPMFESRLTQTENETPNGRRDLQKPNEHAHLQKLCRTRATKTTQLETETNPSVDCKVNVNTGRKRRFDAVLGLGTPSSKYVDLHKYLNICAEKTDGDVVNFGTVVCVCLISRYQNNNRIRITASDEFLYDVICSDKSLLRFKALLDPKFNHLIQQHVLKLGSWICIKHAVCKEEQYNTPKLNRCVKYMHIVELEIVEKTSEILDLDSLVEHPAWNLPLHTVIYPLSGMRRCYLDVWNDSIPFWPDLQLHDSGYLSITHLELDNLVKDSRTVLWKLCDGVMKGEYDVSQMLVVRILCIGSFHQYGNSNDGVLFPYKWNMVVTDGTAACSLCVWGEAVMKLYGRISVGSVLLIMDYTVSKAKTPSWRRFLSLYKALMWLTLEVKINVVSDAEDAFGQPLHIVSPQIDYRCCIHRENFDFKYVSEIMHMDDEPIVDIVGIITRISRYERSMKINISKTCGFWVNYWVEVTDTQMNVIRLKLSINSQENVHRYMEVGQAAIFCNMKVKIMNGQIPQRFLKSCIESQIILLQDDAKERYKHMNAVENVVNIMNSRTLKTLEEIGAVGGGYYYPFPLASPGGLVLIHSKQWEMELNKLMFWQRREILVSAQIVEISFVAVNMPEMPESLQISESCQRGATTKIFLIYSNPNWPFFKDKVRMLGLTNPHYNTFPRKYNRDQPISRPSWFPCLEPPGQTNINGSTVLTETDFVCDGYYHVILSDMTRDVALSCILIPCCEGLGPKIWGMLTGKRAKGVPQPTGGCCAKISWEEVSDFVESTRMFESVESLETFDKCFLLDVFKHDNLQVELILRRAYEISE